MLSVNNFFLLWKLKKILNMASEIDINKVIFEIVNKLKRSDAAIPLSLIGKNLVDRGIVIKSFGYPKLITYFELNQEKYSIEWIEQEMGPKLPSIQLIQSNTPVDSLDLDLDLDLDKFDSGSGNLETNAEKSYSIHVRYHDDKINAKYNRYPRLDSTEKARISKILYHLDQFPRTDIGIVYNQDELGVKILRSYKNIDLCSFNFLLLEPRVIIHLEPHHFNHPALSNIDPKREMSVVTNKGKTNYFIGMNTNRKIRTIKEKDEYILAAVLGLEKNII